MSTSSAGHSHNSYPSWLPKRPPPPAPASTFHSASAVADEPRRHQHQHPHRRRRRRGTGMYPPSVPDVFSAAQHQPISPTTPSSAPAHPQGRKPTPRSVRIVARDANQRWRVTHGPVSDPGPDARLGEQAGDSAETRVHLQQSTARHVLPIPHVPQHRSQPRFRAPSLHLDLLRSPALFMRIRYRLHPLFVFGHLILQTFFDFNTVFMIIQTAKFPGPLTNPRNWNLAAAAYLACYFIQIVLIFILYELVYSFWRRWRVKRPLILPIYLSSPAHNFVGLTSYTHYCFLAYIRRSARPSFRELFRSDTPPLIPLPRSTTQSATPPGSLNSSRPHTPHPQLAHIRSESASSAATTATTDSSAASRGFLALLPHFTPYIAESAYFLSQNTPTVLSLLPRAALSVALLLQPLAGPNLGRDSTYFDPASGALSAYARGVLFANAAWTLWRFVVLLGSFITLWILSGSACAGICGPRYRWEEYPDPESEVEIDEDEDETGWAFVNFSPWRRRTNHHSRRHHSRRKRNGRRRATSVSSAHPESVSVSSSFFSPATPLPPRRSISGGTGGTNVAVQGSEKDHHQYQQQQQQTLQSSSMQFQFLQSRTAYMPPFINSQSLSHSHSYYPTPNPRAYTAEDPPLSDSWDWKRGTRRRIREAWEFCLTNSGGRWVPPPSAAGGGPDAGATDDATKKSASASAGSGSGSGNGNDISLHSDDLRGLDEVLKQSVLHRNVLLRSRTATDSLPESSGVGLSDILPPRDDIGSAAAVASYPGGGGSSKALGGGEGQQFGSQRSRKSDPLRVLPFPIHIGPVPVPGASSSAAAPLTATTSAGSASDTPPFSAASAPAAMATPITPTTATTLTVTGIPFPSPTRSRTRLGPEEEEEEEEEEGEEGEEEGEYEEEIEEYDDDFIDDDEEEYEDDGYEIEEVGEEGEEEVEEYDEDYDLSGSPRAEDAEGEEEQEVYFDEFGVPIPVVGTRPSRGGEGGGGRRATRNSASASGSASMSSLGRPIGGTRGYAFSTVGSATMSSASASGSRRTGTGSRVGTVSSRGTRGTASRSASVSASISASANHGTRSSRGSGSARAASSVVSRSMRRGGRGRGRESVVSASASASASPVSQQNGDSPQSIESGSAASPLNSGAQLQSSPDSENRNQTQTQSGGQTLSPLAVTETSGTTVTTTRPPRERGREYAGASSRLRVPGSPSHHEPSADTSLDIEFPVPASVYCSTGGGGGRRSRRTSSTTNRAGARTRTRTMSSGFDAGGGDLVLPMPMPMPEGYEEDELEDEGDVSRLGYGTTTGEQERASSLPEGPEDENEDQDILGLLSPSSGSSRPASNPPPPGSNPPSGSASASASLHTRSPRSSLKSTSSRSPSLANLAASLGAGMSAGVRHLGSRRVSFTGAGAGGPGSRSRSREERASGYLATPPPLPVQQQSQSQTIRNRAQSLIQSIRNRSSSFVELAELGDDDDNDNTNEGNVGQEEDVTLAFGPGGTVRRPREAEDDGDVDSERLSSPGHSSSNHSPMSNIHSSPSPVPPYSAFQHQHQQRLIGVPRGLEFGSRRDSSGSGTASSHSPASGSASGGARLSGEGRRPLSMLSAALVAAGSEGTFGRPGELADVARRERETVQLVEEEARSAVCQIEIPREEGDVTVSRTSAIPIPSTSHHNQPRHSPSPISTAPASLVTSPPSVSQAHSSTTESVRGPGPSGSGTEEQSSGSAGAGGIDPLWRDQARRGARGPVAGGWPLGPA